MEVQSQGTGASTATNAAIDTDTQVALLRAMRRAQVIEARIAALHAQGTVGFLPSGAGREVALLGALAALRDGDWVFPTMNDWGAALYRGMDVSTFVHRVFGDASDPLKGRDMPGGLSAKALKIASVSAPAATHLPHAVGVAWAARQRGEGLVTAALFDGREVDAADFHTGLNFAGVMKAPTVFLCRVREGGEGAAEHAVAYGLPYASCDGADLPAVYGAVSQAVARAAEGDGATVLDLHLPDADADPVAGLSARLSELGAWSAAQDDELARATEDELASAIEAASRAGEPSLRSLFDDVFEQTPSHLAEQHAQAQRDARSNR